MKIGLVTHILMQGMHEFLSLLLHVLTDLGEIRYSISSYNGINGTLQLRAYANDVNTLEGSVHTVEENAEHLVVATKEIGLEVNADKTKYMIKSRDQNAGQSHSMKTENSSTERMEEFKYLGTTLTKKILFRRKLRAD